MSTNSRITNTQPIEAQQTSRAAVQADTSVPAISLVSDKMTSEQLRAELKLTPDQYYLYTAEITGFDINNESHVAQLRQKAAVAVKVQTPANTENYDNLRGGLYTDTDDPELSERVILTAIADGLEGIDPTEQPVAGETQKHKFWETFNEQEIKDFKENPELLANRVKDLLKTTTDDGPPVGAKLFNLAVKCGKDSELRDMFIAELGRVAASDAPEDAEFKAKAQEALDSSSMIALEYAKAMRTGDSQAQIDSAQEMIERALDGDVAAQMMVVQTLENADLASGNIQPEIIDMLAPVIENIDSIKLSLERVAVEMRAKAMNKMAQNNRMSTKKLGAIVPYQATLAEKDQMQVFDAFNQRAIRDNDANLLNANANIINQLHQNNQTDAFQKIMDATKLFTPEQAAQIQNTLADQIEKSAPENQTAMHESIVKSGTPEAQERAAGNVTTRNTQEGLAQTRGYSVENQAPALTASYEAAIKSDNKSLAQMVADSIAYNQSAQERIAQKPELFENFMIYQGAKQDALASSVDGKYTAYPSSEAKNTSVNKITTADFKSHTYTEQIDIITRMLDSGDKMKAMELAFGAGLGSHVLGRMDASELLSSADGKFRNDILMYLCTSNKMEDKLAMAEYVVGKNDEHHSLYQEAVKIRSDFGVEKPNEKQPFVVNS